MSNSLNRKNIGSFDVAKAVMAVAIVIMHSAFLSGSCVGILFWPWVRLAVPLFFMIASYLFFSHDGERGWSYYRKYTFRIVSLYAIWSVVGLPCINIDGSVVTLLRKTMFSGFWGPTWFFCALVLDLFIVKGAINWPKRWCLPVIVACSFLFCCYSSSYYQFFYMKRTEARFLATWDRIFSYPHMSFVIGMVWTYFGYLFARTRIGNVILTMKLVVGTMLSLVLLFGEWLLVWYFTRSRINDVYVSLLAAVPLVFCLLLNWSVDVKGGLFLRRFSTVLFMSHMPVLNLMDRLKLCNDESHIVPFVATLVVAVVLTVSLDRISRIRMLSFLKCAY